MPKAIPAKCPVCDDVHLCQAPAGSYAEKLRAVRGHVRVTVTGFVAWVTVDNVISDGSALECEKWEHAMDYANSAVAAQRWLIDA